MAKRIQGEEPIVLPKENILGALTRYISDEAHLNSKNSLQPINSNWALVPPIELPKKERKNKKLKAELLSAMALTTLAACQGEGANPLLADWNTPYQTPPFNEIKVEHYAPAFDAAIAEARAEIDAIVADTTAPTFANTIEALERAGGKLTRIEYIFFNILEADADEQMQQVSMEVQPKLTEYSNDVSLNPELFARVKAVYDQRESFDLSLEEAKLLEKTYKSFARSGAALDDEKKAEYREISAELSQLTLQFGQNVLAATNAYTLNITDSTVVAELPDFVKEGLAADAKARGEQGWTDCKSIYGITLKC